MNIDLDTMPMEGESPDTDAAEAMDVTESIRRWWGSAEGIIAASADRAMAGWWDSLPLSTGGPPPTARELADWIANARPQQALTEAVARWRNLPHAAKNRELTPSVGSLTSGGWEFYLAIGQIQIDLAESTEAKNPIAPLLYAWRDAAAKVERRTDAIMPRAAAERIARMPQFANPAPSAGLGHVDAEAYLPGLIPDAEPVYALLDLYDRFSHGADTRKKGPAAVGMRIWLEAALCLPVDHRDGRPRRLLVTVREVAGDWLNWNLTSYRANKPNSGGALERALHSVRGMAIPMPRKDGKPGPGGWYYAVDLRAVEGLALNDRIAIDIMLPETSGIGPPVDRAMLRKLGKISAIAYRAYLTLTFDWDFRGGHRGRLVKATRPEVRRGAGGELIDTKGQPILKRMGYPAYSTYDRRAVHTGRREGNPQRRRYPEMDGDGVMRLCYPPDAIPMSGENRRKYLRRACQAVELIEREGGCEIERLGRDGGLPWRVMPPEKNGIQCPVFRDSMSRF